MPPDINSKAGQKSFEEKKKVYKFYHLLMFNEIIELNDWDKSTIDDRKIKKFIEAVWG